MKKSAVAIVLTACMMLQGVVTFADDEDLYREDAGEATQEAVQMMLYAYAGKMEEAQEDPVRLKEVTEETIEVDMGNWDGEDIKEPVDVCTIEMGDRKMQYITQVVGEPGENGLYPLYIALHGGGEATPDVNNGQWLDMAGYYLDSIPSGIYVAPRGMEDVWNLHFLEESYPMYDRLIEDMIYLVGADPNRVYLLGFSAGGDGVYQIAPRMADRFAAANMSSGHPNGVSLVNNFNLPFEIQVGIHDFYSEEALRSVRGAEFEETLNSYQQVLGLDYPHRVLVHVPNGHNYNDYEGGAGESIVLTDPTEFATRCVEEDWLSQFMDIYTSLGNPDNVSTFSYDNDDEISEALLNYITNDLQMEVDYETDTNAIHYVSEYKRNPMPESMIWDLSTRADARTDKAFYWLKADCPAQDVLVRAAYDKESNAVALEIDGELDADLTILASPYLMDFDRPLTVETDNDSFTVDLKADEEIIDKSINETGDLFLSWADEITVPAQ